MSSLGRGGCIRYTRPPTLSTTPQSTHLIFVNVFSTCSIYVELNMFLLSRRGGCNGCVHGLATPRFPGTLQPCPSLLGSGCLHDGAISRIPKSITGLMTTKVSGTTIFTLGLIEGRGVLTPMSRQEPSVQTSYRLSPTRRGSALCTSSLTSLLNVLSNEWGGKRQGFAPCNQRSYYGVV